MILKDHRSRTYVDVGDNHENWNGCGGVPHLYQFPPQGNDLREVQGETYMVDKGQPCESGRASPTECLSTHGERGEEREGETQPRGRGPWVRREDVLC